MIVWEDIKEYTQISPKSVKLTDVEYPLNKREVILSRSIVLREIETGEPSIVRKNVEGGSLGERREVYPSWEDISEERGTRGV